MCQLTSGLPCPQPPGGSGPSVGTLEGDGPFSFSLRLPWAGSFPQPQPLSHCPCPGFCSWGFSVSLRTAGQELGDRHCPTRFHSLLCPGKAPAPSRSRQWVAPGRNPLSCFPCALPTPCCVGLLSQFLQRTPVCVCHLFLSRAPTEAPEAPGGWSCLQSLPPLRVRSDQRGCTAERGERSSSFALRPFFSENVPLQRQTVVVVVVVKAVAVPTYYELVVVLRTPMH